MQIAAIFRLEFLILNVLSPYSPCFSAEYLTFLIFLFSMIVLEELYLSTYNLKEASE